MNGDLKLSAFAAHSAFLTFYSLCFLFTLAFIPATANGQTIRKTDKGEQIIVYTDGTWQYFSDYLNGVEKRNPAESSEPAQNFPVFEGTIEPLEGDIKVTEQDLFNIAVRRSQLAGEAVNIAQLRWVKAQQARAALERELQQLEKRGQADPAVTEQLKSRIAAAKRTEEESRKEAEDAKRESDRAEFVTKKGELILAAYKEDRKDQLEGETNRQEARSYEQSLPLTDNIVGTNQQDLILHPPQEPCQVVRDGVDPKSGNYHKDLAQQFLFSHTDDRLRVYLKDKEYLRCEGYFSADGGYRYLTLEFTFAYPNAREAYGFIEKGSILTIKMLNGDFVNLRSGVMDRGSYDTETELLTYRVYYPLDRSQMNFLKNSEVDAIRVFWSSGFEEYEVYHLDFFSKQLRCID